jgi:hypothetical protein
MEFKPKHNRKVISKSQLANGLKVATRPTHTTTWHARRGHCARLGPRQREAGPQGAALTRPGCAQRAVLPNKAHTRRPLWRGRWQAHHDRTRGRSSPQVALSFGAPARQQEVD